MLRRRIAWSRNGLVAYIDLDRRAFVTWFVCTDGEHWDRASPLPVPLPMDADPACLSWSPTGFDLNVCDTAGRVHIFGFSSVQDAQTLLSPAALPEPGSREEEAERIVGTHWLGLDKSILVPHPSFDMTLSAAKSWLQEPALGPFPPLKLRNVFICLNVQAKLRVFVQNQNSIYTEHSVQIPCFENVVNVEFVPRGKTLTVLLTTILNELKAFEVHFKYQTQKQATPDNCELSVFPIAAVQLSYQPNGVLALPEDEAVRIRVLNKQGLTEEFLLKPVCESLNPAFLELFTISQPVLPEPRQAYTLELAQQRPNIKLEQQGTVQQPSQPEDVNLVRFYSKSKFLVLIVEKNGSVKTEPVYAGSKILQPELAKLQFDADEIKQAKHLAFSPSAVCAATLDAKTGIKLIKSRIESQTENVGRMFATMYACTVLNSEQCDDVLCCAWTELHKPQSNLFDLIAAESQRLLNVNLSPPEDQRTVDRLVVVPSPPQRWLSFLVALGTEAKWKRGKGCRIALAVLHLQLCAFGLTWTVKKISQRQKTDSAEKLRSDIFANQFYILSMLAPIRWISDLCTRILQDLFDATQLPKEEAEQLLLNENNVCTALLMSSISRYLLRYVLRGIRTLMSSAKTVAEIENRLNSALAVEEKKKFVLEIQAKAQEFSTKNPGAPIPPELNLKDTSKLQDQLRAKLAAQNAFVGGQALRLLVSQLQSLPFQLDAFEKLLLQVDENVKQLFSQPTQPAKKKLEADIINHAMIADFYLPVISPLLESANKICANIDLTRFYFYDTKWLGIDSVGTVLVDGLSKKLLLPNEEKLVCSRCGMLTAARTNKPMMHWLYIFHRYCICGGAWMKKVK